MTTTWAKKMGRYWLTGVRFCPFCGVDNVGNDPYWEEHYKKLFERRGDTKDFMCHTCGKLFRMSPSARGMAVSELHRQSRRLRPGPIDNRETRAILAQEEKTT